MLSFYIPLSHTMEEEVQLHLFSTSELDGGEWWPPRPGRFIPSLDFQEKKSLSCPCRRPNPGPLGPQPSYYTHYIIPNFDYVFTEPTIEISRARQIHSADLHPVSSKSFSIYFHLCSRLPMSSLSGLPHIVLYFNALYVPSPSNPLKIPRIRVFPFYSVKKRYILGQNIFD